MAPAKADRPSAGDSALPRLGLILLALVTLGWGAAWPALKTALTEMDVWTFRAVTVLGGGLVLAALTVASRQTLAVPARQWPALLLVTLFNTIGWQMFSGFGIANMASGRAALVGFTMPTWAALFGAIVFREPPRPRLVVALALGMVGVGLFLWGDRQAVGSSPVGVAYMLVAAASWGLGVVLIKRFRWYISTLSMAAWQLVLGGIVIVIVGFFINGLPWAPLSFKATVALLYVIFIAISFCAYAFIKVVKLFPPNVSAIGTLLIPVIGVVSSSLILGETIGWREIAAMILIVSALILTLFRPVRRS